MAYLAIRGSGSVNGVSRLHGKVSRQLLSLFSRTGQRTKCRRTRNQRSPYADLDSAPADDLWTEACGKGRWLGTTENLEKDIRRVSDATLWQFRIAASKSLI